jgi:hypothetical protein
MIHYNKGGNMVGRLVKWIHDEVPTNLCVIIDDLGYKEDHIVLSEEEENEMLFLCYDFVTNEQFYALESELSFIY